MPLWELIEPIKVGKILKTHSYLGSVRVVFFVSGLEAFVLPDTFLYIEWNEKPVPYMVQSIDWQDEKTAIVHFLEMDYEEEAEKIRGRNIWMKGPLPEEVEEDYFAEEGLIGFQVLDKNGFPLGIIKDIYDNGPQKLLQVSYQDKEYFIPVHQDLIFQVLVRKKQIIVDLPEGLIDLN